MPAHPPLAPGEVLRHFTVAVFVVKDRSVLLHVHRKLGRWLPPGGHIEEGELPDDAAVREVLEETGVRVALVGPPGLPQIDGAPSQLTTPLGIQLEEIYPGHQHIDLVYLARPLTGAPNDIDPALRAADRVGWYALPDLEPLGADAEIRAWSAKAVAALEP